VPDGAILIFSAHGVSQAVRNEAKSRDLTVFDATCPLVTKVHMEVARASRRGEESILIGHAGHPEVEGTMGQYSNPQGGCTWWSRRKMSDAGREKRRPAVVYDPDDALRRRYLRRD
jgi:4-hydroxy-3-methylbut-2-enyl diphosphate reductase